MIAKASKAQRGKAKDRGRDEGESAREKHFVNGLAKGLTMIQAFSAETPALTLAEAAVATSLTRASARRILMTLEDLGFVAREGLRHFILTPKILSLGYSYLASTPLWSFASPVLQDLVEDVRETCAIAVQDGTDLVYVLRIPVHRILSQGLIVGSRLPLYCHSAGRVLLSDFSPAQLDSYFAHARLKPFTLRTVVDEARLRKLVKDAGRQQYAWVGSEIEESVAGLSVPIRHVDGRVVAALNVSVKQSSAKKEAMINRLLPRLQAAADRIHGSLSLAQPMHRAAGAPRLKGQGG